MKRINPTAMTVALLFFGKAMIAQHVRELFIASDKTTSIIFPYAIRSVDKGTRDVLAQKVKNADTVLQLKAAKPGFTQTNITVITADGELYTFLVSYNANVNPFPIYIPREPPATVEVAYSPSPTTAELEAQAFDVERQPAFQHVQTASQGMKLALKATHISEQVLWLTVQLSNKSQVTFRPEYIRFFLVDRKRSKRTAVQETELTPIFMEPPPSIHNDQPLSFAAGFTPFTVPPSKRLIIQVGEKAGGRSLSLRVNARTLLKARQLPPSSNHSSDTSFNPSSDQ